jgi:hypothetical protein
MLPSKKGLPQVHPSEARPAFYKPLSFHPPSHEGFGFMGEPYLNIAIARDGRFVKQDIEFISYSDSNKVPPPPSGHKR